MLDMWKLIRNCLDERHKHRVEKQYAIFSVVDDVDEMLGKQPRVDRMQYIARARDTVIELQVPVIVPR